MSQREFRDGADIRPKNATTFDVPLGEAHKIVPTDVDFDLIEEKHPHASEAEKYRLMQANALLRAWRDSKNGA